jgi:protein phosphatase
MQAAGITDVGKKRSQNQDSIFVSAEPVGPLPNMFIVADGMGGHNAGDVASRLAVTQFCEYIKLNTAPYDDYQELCVSAANHANRFLYQQAAADTSLRGMGTTFTACFITEKRIKFIHIGDSRIYMVTPSGITQLTNDHSFVNEMVKAGHITPKEAREHPQRNVLLKVMNGDELLEIDVCTRSLKRSCAVLLCSDGLNGMITDDEIKAIVNRDDTAEAKVRMLTDAANDAGGSDNISVILIEDIKTRAVR